MEFPISAEDLAHHVKTTLGPQNHEKSGQIITTSAEVTPNGGLVGESPQNPLNSG